MRRAAGVAQRFSVLSTQRGVQRLFVPAVVINRNGSTATVEHQGPPPPLHTIARFTFEEVTDLFMLYKNFTSNKSCMVNKEDFAQFLAPLGIEATPRNIETYFKRFEQPDGTACLKEFVSTTTSCVEGNQERLAEYQFLIWDADKDGKLSKEDYLQMLPYANPSKLNSTQIRSAGNELFYKLDGGNGALSMEDYKRGIYMTQKEFGAIKLSRGVRSSAGAPLVRWASWDFWDYLAIFSSMSLSFGLFYPW